MFVVKITRLAMEKIEGQVDLLLDGKALVEDAIECDFTLAEQNELTVLKGATPAVPDDFHPVLHKNVTYIVCVVLVNSADEVLMIQEAKKPYAGTWYLPAGRMEPGETIQEAAKREVLEETGLDFEPTTLLTVECARSSWIRFVLVGDVIAGRLKTTSDADSESLQAKWVKDLNSLTLRSKDILPLIEFALLYKENKNCASAWHKPLLPAFRGHGKQMIRILVIVRKRVNNHIHVLVAERETPHLPVCEMNPAHSIYSTLKKFMQRLFPSELPPHKPHGLLSVEHLGKPHGEYDGLCLNLILSVRTALEEVALSDGYTWLEVSQELGAILLQRIARNMTISLNVIR